MPTPSALNALMLDRLDAARRQSGLLTIGEIMERVARDNVVLDPCSLLIGVGVSFGLGNVFRANVEIVDGGDGSVVIGDDNRFLSGCAIRASAGRVVIGNGNWLGEGGLVIDADRAGGAIVIGDEGRYRYGAVIRGAAALGSGSQVLGPVIVDGCSLGAGGSHLEPDPDRRGGVLKGVGPARGLTVPRGQVIASYGPFAQHAMQPQRFFHPKATPGVD